jgi:glyoxalase family protein
MRQSGRKGRPGAGQIGTLGLSVPVSSLEFWHKRLVDHGFAPQFRERFGEGLIAFAHPCGIEYELIGIADDPRKPYSNGAVPAELAIRGTHGITVKVRELEPSQEFMVNGWSGREIARDGKFVRYELADHGPGAYVDLALEPELPQGSWTYGEGIVHHCAFQVDDYAAQDGVKANLEGLGFTDTSERKDRGYFDSIYVRTPGGGMFEATVSKPRGFTVDEPFDSLGSEFKVPPVFAERREEIMTFLEPVKY